MILSIGSGPGGRWVKSIRPDHSQRDFWISVYDYFDKLTASTGSFTNPRKRSCRWVQAVPEVSGIDVPEFLEPTAERLEV